MKTELFEQLGLTPGERKSYLALLETGITTAGPLVKRTGMQKSAVYFCLERLLDKGLASFVMRNNVKQFEAARPARLLDYLDERTKEIEEQRKAVGKMLPELEKIMPKSEKKMARTYEGWNGMRSAFDDILETLKAGDEYYVFSVNPDKTVFDRFRRFINRFHAQRARKKIAVKIILGEQMRATVGKDRKAEPHTDVRYAAPEYLTPATINVYGSKVLVALWTETPTAFTIESRDVAESFRNYFEILWKTAGK